MGGGGGGGGLPRLGCEYRWGYHEPNTTDVTATATTTTTANTTTTTDTTTATAAATTAATITTAAATTTTIIVTTTTIVIKDNNIIYTRIKKQIIHKIPTSYMILVVHVCYSYENWYMGISCIVVKLLSYKRRTAQNKTLYALSGIDYLANCDSILRQLDINQTPRDYDTILNLT